MMTPEEIREFIKFECSPCAKVLYLSVRMQGGANIDPHKAGDTGGMTIFEVEDGLEELKGKHLVVPGSQEGLVNAVPVGELDYAS